MEIKTIFPEYEEDVDVEEFIEKNVNRFASILPSHLRYKLHYYGFEYMSGPHSVFKYNPNKMNDAFRFFEDQVRAHKSWDIVLVMGRNDENFMNIFPMGRRKSEY